MKFKEKKYLLVKKFILKSLEDGAYKPGDKIATEDKIMEIMGFSRSPVRQAIMQLEHEGTLYKIQGSGSFVKQTVTNEALDIYALLYLNSKGIEKDFIYGMRQAVNNSSFRDLHLILKKPGRNTKEMIDILQSIDTVKRGGIIIVPILDRSRPVNRLLAANLRKFEKQNFTVVQLDSFVPEYEGNCVRSDHRKGTYDMVKHLIEKGHRKIAIIYEHPENTSTKLRLRGVKECLEAHGLSLPGSYQFQIELEEIVREGERIVKQIQKENISALFCFESEITLEIYKILTKHDMRIPQDISLSSFDDHSFIGFHDMAITSVVQPLEDLGYFAVDLILRSLGKKIHEPITMVMEPLIVERQSVAKIL